MIALLRRLRLLLWGFLFENVAGVAMISFNLTGTGLGKTLSGTSVGFHLRH